MPPQTFISFHSGPRRDCRLFLGCHKSLFPISCPFDHSFYIIRRSEREWSIFYRLSHIPLSNFRSLHLFISFHQVDWKGIFNFFSRGSSNFLKFHTTDTLHVPSPSFRFHASSIIHFISSTETGFSIFFESPYFLNSTLLTHFRS